MQNVFARPLVAAALSAVLLFPTSACTVRRIAEVPGFPKVTLLEKPAEPEEWRLSLAPRPGAVALLAERLLLPGRLIETPVESIDGRETLKPDTRPGSIPFVMMDVALGKAMLGTLATFLLPLSGAVLIVLPDDELAHDAFYSSIVVDLFARLCGTGYHQQTREGEVAEYAEALGYWQNLGLWFGWIVPGMPFYEVRVEREHIATVGKSQRTVTVFDEDKERWTLHPLDPLPSTVELTIDGKTTSAPVVIHRGEARLELPPEAIANTEADDTIAVQVELPGSNLRASASFPSASLAPRQ